MEQGHAGGFAFTAGAAALSGCSGMNPQLWNGRETILALRDSLETRNQGMGLLGTQSRNLAGSGHCAGHKEWSCQRDKPFHDLPHPAQLKLSGPGRQGANTARPKASPTMPSWGLGAAGRATPLPWHPGALPAAAPLCGGLSDAAAPMGKWQCHIWMCHHEPGNCQGQHWERGHSSGMAEEAAWPQQAQKEWEEEGLHVGEDAEATPGALAGAFCSKNRLISFISSPLPCYPPRPAAPPHTKAASLLKSPAHEAGRWLE